MWTKIIPLLFFMHELAKCFFHTSGCFLPNKLNFCINSLMQLYEDPHRVYRTVYQRVGLWFLLFWAWNWQVVQSEDTVWKGLSKFFFLFFFLESCLSEKSVFVFQVYKSFCLTRRCWMWKSEIVLEMFIVIFLSVLSETFCLFFYEGSMSVSPHLFLFFSVGNKNK